MLTVGPILPDEAGYSIRGTTLVLAGTAAGPGTKAFRRCSGVTARGGLKSTAQIRHTKAKGVSSK